MKLINRIGRTVSFSNRKFNSMNLILLFTIASFIGAFSMILPSLLSGIGAEGESLDNRSGSDLGYEEIIQVSVDRYGNLTVIGSFHGPQVTPDVNWSLPEYGQVWSLSFSVINKNMTDYHYERMQSFKPGFSKNDAYLYLMFLTYGEGNLAYGMENPVVLGENERLQAAETIKSDLERAFGIQNNFSASPIVVASHMAEAEVIGYGFNFSPQVDFSFFLQYFADHTPSGLADCFSTARINSTYSAFEWVFANQWQYTEQARSLARNPLADYASSFEYNVVLKYPGFFGPSYPPSSYTFNLSDVCDAPFSPLSAFNESAFSISEINVVVENGNITSPPSNPYHIPRYTGLDHDYWLLLNASYYDAIIDGLGAVPDVRVDFSTNLVNTNFVSPSPGIFAVDVYIDVDLQTNITPPSSLTVEIYDEATFMQDVVDDLSFLYGFPHEPVERLQLNAPYYNATWSNTYRFPNGSYYIYTYGNYVNCSLLTPRSKYGGWPPGGVIYNYTRVTLGNLGQTSVLPISPLPNAVVSNDVNIIVNITGPETILGGQWAIFNYSERLFKGIGAWPMDGGILAGGPTTWSATWDSTSVPSTENYILSLVFLDSNSSELYYDIPITVNNTLYQENVPIFAPMGGSPDAGYDLRIGSFEQPIMSDPTKPGSSDGGPVPLMFYGYGVDYGVDFTASLYADVPLVVFITDNNWTRNPVYDQIAQGIPEFDYALGIMMMEDTPESQATVSQIVTEFNTAFNVPPMQYINTYMIYMDEHSPPVPLYLYGGNYAIVTYQTFIDKFHTSVPAGMSNMFTAQNMTQPGIESSIFFGWMNPDLFVSPFSTYNTGLNAYISPSILIPDFFDSTLESSWTVSLQDLFPHISQYNACAPTTSTAILSGVGPSIVGQVGAIALNANITDWYPRNGNVTPLSWTGNCLNVLGFTMLDNKGFYSGGIPTGLLTTDDIRFNFTGPYITNNIVSPATPSIDLYFNVTVTSQCTSGEWNETRYQIDKPMGRGNSTWRADLVFNGNNWTDEIDSLSIKPGWYQLTTFVRDNVTQLWALNQTMIYINNSIFLSPIMVNIASWGDVELMGGAGIGGGSQNFYGYGANLGIDTTLEEYNSTDLLGVAISFSSENNPSPYPILFGAENWNIFIMVIGNETTTEAELKQIATPIIVDLESVFDIPGMLQPLGVLDASLLAGIPVLAWGANYTALRDYDYFLDQYETVRRSNSSDLFSKDNLLMADASFISYTIFPEFQIQQMMMDLGYPEMANGEEPVMISPYMRFNNYFQYPVLNQSHEFSLANMLGVSQIQTDYEQSMTYGASSIMASLAHGSIDNATLYPNYPGLTQYFPGTPDMCMFVMQDKREHVQMGLNSTDDIRFNFTAPYTILNILSPTRGSTGHGTLDIIANATMLAPTTADMKAYVFQGNARSWLSSISTFARATIDLTYDSVNHYWSGTWLTINESIPNGWYDIIIQSEDALGRLQYNYTSVYVQNTYYQETLGIQVDQFGNITASAQFSGSAIDLGWNASLMEQEDIILVALQATNSYSGSGNYSKQMIRGWMNTPPNDVGLAVMFDASAVSDAEALLIANPLKDEIEQALGIGGMLNLVTVSPFFMMPGVPTMKTVYYGVNYSPALTYGYLVDYFHQTVPSGINNTLDAILRGQDSFLQFLQFTDPSMSFSGTPPPNMDGGASPAIMAISFYPQYYGANFLGDTLTPHTLSLNSVCGMPQFGYASPDVADSLTSRVSVGVDNGNMTSWYPDIPNIAQLTTWSGLQTYYATLSTHNYYDPYSSTPGYQYGEFDLSVDDINVTFDEPFSRVSLVSPAPGAVIDGTIDVSATVENRSPITNVWCKVYTEAEYAMLPLYAMMGGSGASSRMAGVYGMKTMTEVSPGTWNQTWLAYQQDDGPLWVEVIMETQDGFYSYNLTKVTIANSNPLALNPVSPASHDSVSGVVTLSAQVVNSTPISQVTCTIYDGNMMLPLDVMTLEPQGGDLYSAYWGSQGTYDGKYYFAFSVRDTFGAVAYNISSKVDISNPIHFEIQLLEPTSTLGWSPNASLIATTTGPFYTKSMDYTITQYYYDPDSRQYENIAVMDSGSMVDPDSTWIAEIDTSRYPKMVSVWDGWHWDHYVAYYQIEIIGKDTGYGTTRFSEYFTLGDAELVKASIIFPFDHMAVSNVFSVNVSTTSPADFFLYINGTVRDAHDNVVQELDFTNYGNTADAVVYSYAYPNGWYTIEAWGETTNGTFYDTVTVQFDNLIVFSVQFVNPPEGGTLTGDVTIQLQIYNATDLVHIWVDISEYEHGPQLVYLGSFDYNMTSGYWEETWASWELPDGNYYISCGAKDINDIEVYGESNFILNNPPNVTILEPAPASSFVEKENIHFVVRIPDTDVDHVELWAEGDYIMNFTKSVGENWTADWSDTMGYDGAVFIQVFAYDTSGLVNNTQWIGISISRVTPPAGHADIYEITTTNSTGGEQTTFSQGETVEYHSIIRGDAGNTTYVVTAQTNDPLLNGYLEYNETVTVTAGQDIEVVFNFNISAGAPTGTYTVQILVWTDWPWNGGICVDFITITFEVV